MSKIRSLDIEIKSLGESLWKNFKYSIKEDKGDWYAEFTHGPKDCSCNFAYEKFGSELSTAKDDRSVYGLIPGTQRIRASTDLSAYLMLKKALKDIKLDHDNKHKKSDDMRVLEAIKSQVQVVGDSLFKGFKPSVKEEKEGEWKASFSYESTKCKCDFNYEHAAKTELHIPDNAKAVFIRHSTEYDAEFRLLALLKKVKESHDGSHLKDGNPRQG